MFAGNSTRRRWCPPREINHLAGALSCELPVRLQSLERYGVILKMAEKGGEEASRSNNDRLQAGLVVKEQVVLRQRLVCAESILAGESRAGRGESHV